MYACEMQICCYRGVNILQELNFIFTIWRPSCGEFFFWFFLSIMGRFSTNLFYIVDENV